MTVDITQDHIDHANAIARRLAHTNYLAGRAGADELQSEGLVALWGLALTWDETSGVPFEAYLSLTLQRRLIDWLRHEYGRVGSERHTHQLAAVSLDEATDTGAIYDKPSPAPSVETVVTDRETLTEVATAIRGCTERQRDALLWPLLADTSRWVERKWGMSKASADAHRYAAKARVRSACAA